MKTYIFGLLRNWSKRHWKVSIFILSHVMKVKVGCDWGPKIWSNHHHPSPPSHIDTRVLCKISKMFPLVMNLGRMSERGIKFQPNSNLLDCRFPMTLLWRHHVDDVKFHQNLKSPRHLMMVDSSFFMFRDLLFKKHIWW